MPPVGGFLKPVEVLEMMRTSPFSSLEVFCRIGKSRWTSSACPCGSLLVCPVLDRTTPLIHATMEQSSERQETHHMIGTELNLISIFRGASRNRHDPCIAEENVQTGNLRGKCICSVSNRSERRKIHAQELYMGFWSNFLCLLNDFICSGLGSAGEDDVLRTVGYQRGDSPTTSGLVLAASIDSGQTSNQGQGSEVLTSHRFRLSPRAPFLQDS